ncbi:MAG: translation initiation factor IF-5A [Euryarchaeota archaeon]|nr:translation initiation factor IF-5A [Euryarchaeota archaeon]
MNTKVVEVKELKVGKFVMVDGEPCKVMSIQTAKTGKHGSAKARVEGIGILDNRKRSFVSPVEAKIEVPILERKSAQVLAFMGNVVQLMDLDTYATFELPKPSPEEIEGTLVEGAEAEYIEVVGKKKIVRVR